MEKIISQVLRKMKTAYRDIKLFWNVPIEYIYSFTYPSNKFIKIEPYDPEVTKAGFNIIKDIQSKYPELKIHFLGSAALKISGQRDLDLIAEAEPKDFEKYLPGIIEVIGSPVKRRKTFIEWQFEKGSCKGELLLTHPKNPIATKPLEVYQIFKNNKYALKLYEKLKLASDGTSVREYKRRRLEFFVKIKNLA